MDQQLPKCGEYDKLYVLKYLKKVHLPYAKMKTEIVNASSVLPCMLRSEPRLFVAGATMEDATGEMKVNADIVKTLLHFRPLDQLYRMHYVTMCEKRIILIATNFLGFSGSLGPSQSTIIVPLSSLGKGRSAFPGSPFPSTVASSLAEDAGFMESSPGC